eukprot:COSAG05_NODE_1147_length_5730_cov_3.054520_13_plen_95_part_00
MITALIFGFVDGRYPDIFTDSHDFDSAFNLTKSEVDDDMLAKAHYMLRPFILRRIKADVEKTVPPKEEIKVFCPLRSEKPYTSVLVQFIGTEFW